MAIMRTNRLTSKTTPPPRRSFTPSAELEAQDKAYKRYQQDTEAYNVKMKKYNESLTSGRDYRPFFGSESNTRRLSAQEAADWNKKSYEEKKGDYLHNPGDLFMEERNINVNKDSYKKLSAPGGKEYQGSIRAYLSDYVKPTPPTKVDKADWSNVELNKMSTKKPVIKTKPGRLKDLKSQEELPGFDAPGVETKTVSKTRAAMTGGGDKLVRAKNPKGNLGAARVTTESNKGKLGYNRQEKLFKSYAGTSVLDESHIGKSAQDINAYKKEMKSQRRAYRREGNLEGVAATGMEVRQARQAERFVKGKQTHFNDENYQKTTGNTTKIAEDYRDSSQNAANRNTMQSKLAAVSARGKNNTSLY